MYNRLMETRKEYLPFGKPNYSDAEIQAVTRVMKSGWVGMGSETMAFEQALAAYLDVPYVITVNSCTSALFLSLLLEDVGPGDEVIVPSLTWCSTANAALYVGATPVFCDVDPDTLCLTPETIQAKITPHTKAVISVHFGGLAVNIDALEKSLPSHIRIIEDAAHAFGSLYPHGRRVGSSGHPTCFSFYANKNLSTGEGGAIALAHTSLAERARMLRQHGLPIDAWKRFIDPETSLSSNPLRELGYKMNYTDLQAAIGIVQLKRQAEFHEKRLAIAQRYQEQLGHLGITFPHHQLHPDHARHLFIAKLPVEEMAISRNQLFLELRKRNIGVSLHYTPLHLMDFYQPQPPLVHTEDLFNRIITLPISSSMNLTDADYVIEHMKSLFLVKVL